MTALTLPVKGRAEDQLADHAECGSLACQSVLEIVSPGAVMPIEDNSTASMLATGVAKTLPTAKTSIVSGNLADVVAMWIPRNCYVIGLVHCTGNAVPTPPPATAAHWVAIYDTDGSYYQCWTATYQPAFDMRACSDGIGSHLVIDLSEAFMFTAAQVAQLMTQVEAIFQSLYGPFENSPTIGVPWNNVEILRRMLADLGAPYSPSSAVPFVPSLVPIGGTGLTLTQAQAVAEIPAIAGAIASGDLTLAHIEAALKGA